jgi:hypothetical protein
VICAVKSLKVKLKARSEFSNVWGELKKHSYPYIQRTAVPCDVHVCIVHYVHVLCVCAACVLAHIVKEWYAGKQHVSEIRIIIVLCYSTRIGG